MLDITCLLYIKNKLSTGVRVTVALLCDEF